MITASVADWIVYAAARGDVIENTAASAQALVRATDHIQFTYVDRFGGGVTPDPDVVNAAVYEAAKLELATPGFWSKTFTPDQQKVLVEVKGIKWETRGDASGAEGATPVSTKIEAMLRRYMLRLPGVFTV